MEIDHTAVFVKDLEIARTFYETYFDGFAEPLYHNPRTGLRAYFLRFGSGARLEILDLAETAPSTETRQCGWDHVAFRVDSNGAVDHLTNRLRADRYEVLSGPRTSETGLYVSVVLDPDGNHIELLA